MIGSLRGRLAVVWVASLAAFLAIGVLLVQLHAQSASALAARADLAGAQACDRLADRFGFYATGWDGPPSGKLDAATRRDLTAVAQAAATFGGVSLGFWRDGEGVVAATPLAPPSGETDALAAAAADTIAGDAIARRTAGTSGNTLLLACPVHGPLRDLVGWVRVAVADTPGLDRLRLGVGVLLALAAGISAWLTWMVTGWNRRVGMVETALADAVKLPRTGLRELDRLVAALDAANARLATARDRAAANERLAALGRVAAGVAHEIRNPVAAMRLGAENALAGDPARRGAALEDMLRQIARLDRLIAELLEMTQHRAPRIETVEVANFLRECADEAGRADAAVTSDVATAAFDPVMVGRVLAILLDNVGRHAPGSAVRLRAETEGDTLAIDVIDDGPGIDPAVRGALFEPFVTGRPDGTGLGLAIGRELAQAHGGALTLHETAKGAAFRLSVPWRRS